MILNSESLITGIAKIDEQHQALFSNINNLNMFVESKESFYEALLGIQIYIRDHFKTEEEYMRYMSYSGYEEHKASHDKFEADFKSLLKKNSSTDDFVALGNEFIMFIEDWVLLHYSNEDIKMAEFMIKMHFQG